ncbi:MAG TPA: mononuclear molybdenum enzyme YedY, partial [Hyphomicrobiales bacterium]|nr:mononuclear molybdenum enzyme YedY [Hyphomicrobiales bacterium]
MIRSAKPIASSEITPREIYMRRREFMASAASAAALAALPRRASSAPLTFSKSAFSTDEPLTPKKDVTSYNNYYEFGTAKTAPASYADALKTSPWSIKVDGLAAKPG